MFKVAISSFRARKLRFALTAIAIIIGVGFVSGAFVMSDSILAAFDDLFKGANKGIDITVRDKDADPAKTSTDAQDGILSQDPNDRRLPESVAERIEAVPGVAESEPFVTGAAQLVDRKGELVGTGGPPKLGFSWSDNAELASVRLVKGRAPTAADEIVVDEDAARLAKTKVGQKLKVVADNGRTDGEFTLVGIARFGEDNTTQGATLSFFEFRAAQKLFDSEGRVDGVSARAEAGIRPAALRDRVQKALDDVKDAQVITADEATKEQVEAIDSSFLKFIRYGALGFAGISLFVAAFLIFNTFSIIVAQRIRELGLLRAVGASRRQVNGMIVIESFVVALVASAIGVIAGLGVAKAITSLFDALGIELPQGDLTLAPRTIIVAMSVGLVVTMISAVVPALRAGRISPVEALRADSVRPPAKRWRRVVGSLLSVLTLVVGAVFIGLGLFVSDDGSSALLNVGGGFVLVVIGLTLVGPVFVSPVVAVVGYPMRRVGGVAGRLASRNATRNRRRTMNTAGALMIGIALVAFIVIFVDSTRVSIERQIDRAVGADITMINAAAQTGPAYLSPEIAKDAEKIDGVESAVGVRFGRADAGGGGRDVLAASGDRLDDAISLKIVSGSVDSLADDEVVVSETVADAEGWKVGERVKLNFEWKKVKRQSFEVSAIYEDTGLSELIISEASFKKYYPPSANLDYLVFVSIADGEDAKKVRKAIEKSLKDKPYVDVQDATDIKEQAGKQLQTFLAMLSGLLVFAVLIAFFGIVNTMALSVFERTREIGLLRAVGMTRRQVRRMVRGESILVAVLGAVLGLLVGIALGWAFVTSLKDDGLEVISIPVVQLAVILIISAIAGVLAAILPARRASRMDVLQAISHE